MLLAGHKHAKDTLSMDLHFISIKGSYIDHWSDEILRLVLLTADVAKIEVVTSSLD